MGSAYYFRGIYAQKVTRLSDEQINNIPISGGISSTQSSSMTKIENKPDSNSPQNQKVVFPLPNFYDRITLNYFGNYLSSGNQSIETNNETPSTCSKGKAYVGYHTADDLEVIKDEINQSVPVYSIAEGIVKQAGYVNGYGGLIVIEHTISGQTYSTYYGHIDLSKTTIKVGDKVTPGEKITELAPECTAQNGYTRKHLHFGIRKDSSIKVAGYVADKNSLAEWIDPKAFFQSLNLK